MQPVVVERDEVRAHPYERVLGPAQVRRGLEHVGDALGHGQNLINDLNLAAGGSMNMFLPTIVANQQLTGEELTDMLVLGGERQRGRVLLTDAQVQRATGEWPYQRRERYYDQLHARPIRPGTKWFNTYPLPMLDAPASAEDEGGGR